MNLNINCNPRLYRRLKNVNDQTESAPLKEELWNFTKQGSLQKTEEQKQDYENLP